MLSIQEPGLLLEVWAALGRAGNSLNRSGDSGEANTYPRARTQVNEVINIFGQSSSVINFYLYCKITASPFQPGNNKELAPPGELFWMGRGSPLPPGSRKQRQP